ncbi:metallophosphoesterase family protein [Fuchsiella alkaliacetigena]|uniref:metallophosphoesterase family protein n=1 Tax=Fuchsiella alkaliacetigena TaxID=957042 RepID=UPI00200A2CFC|nr:metallophosphoesterase [Fuchsiella alkaliacetigena]MCK8824264.1 metallophosphoesterase family protein [Fuchsiella alkaliacetigena]
MKKKIVLIVVGAILGMLLVVNLMGGITYELSAVEVELEANISSENFTEINLPPVGKIIADTHVFPLNLKVTVLNLNPERLSILIDELEDKEELLADIKLKGRNILQLFIIKTLLLAIAGGALGVFILGNRQWHQLVIGGVIALVLLSSLYLGTYLSYDLDRFSDSDYRGMISAAPWMTRMVEEGLENIDQLGEEIEIVVTNISNLFREVEALRALGEADSELRVLHVSDIHNNPVAFNFISQVINSFEVDLIIDSGDISDYGTPVEGKLVSRIADLELPYIFVPGNHDSPTIIEDMSKLDNVVVLEEDTLSIKGLNIVGIADPAAQTKDIQPPEIGAVEEYQDRLSALVEELSTAPDLVVTHNYLITAHLLGEVPVIIHGHSHSIDLRQEAGTTIIDAGTTGAAGIRGLQVKQGVPFSLALLHFSDREEELQLRAVDIIKIHGRESGFIIERKGIN